MEKFLLTGVIMMLFASAFSQQPETKERTRTVSVRGEGFVKTAPDQIRLSVQVNTRGESASAAMSQASAKTRSVLALLKNYGIEDREIQTSYVTVSPILDYSKNIQPPPILGYNGMNDFSVVFKGKMMDNVGDFMDKAVKAGATSFGGLQYENSKQRELERDALKKAASDAQARADVLAKELGAILGKVMTIAEAVSGGPIPVPMMRSAAMMDAGSSAAPIMTGELSISAHVDAVFELK